MPHGYEINRSLRQPVIAFGPRSTSSWRSVPHWSRRPARGQKGAGAVLQVCRALGEGLTVWRKQIRGVQRRTQD